MGSEAAAIGLSARPYYRPRLETAGDVRGPRAGRWCRLFTFFQQLAQVDAQFRGHVDDRHAFGHQELAA